MMNPITEESSDEGARLLSHAKVGRKRSITRSVRDMLCRFSNWRRASETAKRPIITGMNWMPAESSVLPKVKRGYACMVSKPIIAIENPRTPLMRPLTSLSSATEATTVSASTASMKYSAGPNESANPASAGANSPSAITPSSPPTHEAMTEIVRAWLACPCRVIACPSITEAAEAGVPGARMRIAGIEPAYTAPPYIPRRSIIPVKGSSVKVNGSKTATPTVAEMPGSAPTTIPMTSPRTMNNNT